MNKERRDFVRRQNRGVRKICRRRKTKVSRPLFIIRAKRVIDGCLLWLSQKDLEGKCRLTLITVNSTRLGLLRGRWPCGERVRCSTILSKIVDKTPDDRGRNRGKPWSIEMLASLAALCDYRPTRKQDEGAGGDLHWGLRH